LPPLGGAFFARVLELFRPDHGSQSGMADFGPLDVQRRPLIEGEREEKSHEDGSATGGVDFRRTASQGLPDDKIPLVGAVGIPWQRNRSDLDSTPEDGRGVWTQGTAAVRMVLIPTQEQ